MHHQAELIWEGSLLGKEREFRESEKTETQREKRQRDRSAHLFREMAERVGVGRAHFLKGPHVSA